jgi:hypothetical protein
MKLISLRVIVATDDEVELKEVKPLLAQIISERGTEALERQVGIKPRIHWGTVEVLQGPESTRARSRNNSKRQQTSQPELPT